MRRGVAEEMKIQIPFIFLSTGSLVDSRLLVGEINK